MNIKNVYILNDRSILYVNGEGVKEFLQNLISNDINKVTDNKKKYENIRSHKMLKPIVEILNNNDFYINNLDINLICEQPKVSNYRDKIIKSLSNLLNIDKELINLKGKTVEKLGLIGKEKAIACEVICSITQ